MSDDEDLEALRLAALQSLKRKNGDPSDVPATHNSKYKSTRFNRPLKNNKRGRFFGSNHGRNHGKNGQFTNYNTRVRNTNLISIPTISDEKKSEEKVNLPQDKYLNIDKEEKSNDTANSKFSRYDKSDSESDEEDEDVEEEESEEDSPGKLERSNSLEALMQELDDEIQGITKPKEDKLTVKKKIKKKKKRMVSDSANEASESDVKEAEKKETSAAENVKEEKEKVPNDESLAKENQKPTDQLSPNRRNSPNISPRGSELRSRSRSPRNRRSIHPNRRNRRHFQQNQMSFTQNIPPFGQPPVQFTSQPFINPQFNSAFAPPGLGRIVPNQIPPFTFDRPLSPLSINTEQLTTATMAPLSPRSARFVLQNREIIEKRKRSPRRSYSRSPSPRYRRSKSPRRSMSPRRNSVSPRRISPRRRSLSPRRSSPNKRLPLTKKDQTSPKTKPPVHERLGLKPTTKTEDKKPSQKIEEPKVTLDPVLEARKRKFENKEIKIKEGIIRLKPKDDEILKKQKLDVENAKETVSEEKQQLNEETKMESVEEPELDLENINEDELLEDDTIELESKMDDIFSDDESASDNEGRFKAKDIAAQKVPVLPFTKLLNGVKQEIKEKPLISERRSQNRNNKRPERRERRTVIRSRTPVKPKEGRSEKVSADNKKESQPKVSNRRRVVRAEKRHTPPPLEKRFERKIEIKIKNPSKYEKDINTEKEGPENKPSRKVELDSKDVLEDDDTEVIVENESEEEEISNAEGDLRAQLSKKRAERLHKCSPKEGTASRLLQNALQGAIFKKEKKTKDKDVVKDYNVVRRFVQADYSNRFDFAVKSERKVRFYKQIKFYYSYPSDGKLPIHLRLGIAANNADIFSEAKPRKNSKKTRNRSLEQVKSSHVKVKQSPDIEDLTRRMANLSYSHRLSRQVSKFGSLAHGKACVRVRSYDRRSERVRSYDSRNEHVRSYDRCSERVRIYDSRSERVKSYDRCSERVRSYDRRSERSQNKYYQPKRLQLKKF